MRSIIIIICIFAAILPGCRESMDDLFDPVDHEKIDLLKGRWMLIYSDPESNTIRLDFQNKNKLWVIYPDIPDTSGYGYTVREGYLIIYTMDAPPDRIEFDYYIAEIDEFRLTLHFYNFEHKQQIQTYQRITWL